MFLAARQPKRFLWPLTLLAVVLSLSGCAHRPPAAVEVISSWSAQRALLLAQQQFQFTGRLAVASSDDGFSGGIDWQQRAAVSSLRLRGPLGTTAVQVEFDGQTLDLRLSDGSDLRGGAATEALSQALGFDAPLSSLSFWLRGCDDPASPAETTFDAQNRLASLGQRGWQISYDSYQRQGVLWLPRQLTLRRESVRVRLLIQTWTVSG